MVFFFDRVYHPSLMFIELSTEESGTTTLMADSSTQTQTVKYLPPWVVHVSQSLIQSYCKFTIAIVEFYFESILVYRTVDEHFEVLVRLAWNDVA